MRLLLFTIILLSTSQLADGDWDDWDCGGVEIDGDSVCVCGDTNITYSDHDDDAAACCGRDDTCYVKQDGSVNCPDGQQCTSRWKFF